MVYVLLGTGFEEVEAITPIDLLRRADIPVTTVGITGKTVFGGHNIGIEADITIDEINPDDMDMIVLPGGLGGVASARASEKAMELLRYAWNNDKFVAAICAAPFVLGSLGLLAGRKATCYPGFEDRLTDAIFVGGKVAVDGNIITSAGMGCAQEFGYALACAYAGRESANRVMKQVMAE